MKIETTLECLMRSLRFIEQTDTSLLDVGSTQRGLQLSIPGNLNSSVEVAGEVMEATPSHGSVTIGMLRLFHRTVSRWSGEINEEGVCPISIELTGHNLTASPLMDSNSSISIPLRRVLESSESKKAWGKHIVVHVSHSLDGIRDLVRTPSKRDPGEGITRINIEPGIIDVYSFDGHILAHHQTFVRTDGYLEADIASGAFRKALSSHLYKIGRLDIKTSEEALSMKRDHLEVVLGKAQSPIFEQALRCLNNRNTIGTMMAQRTPLLRLCKTAEKVAAKHIEVLPEKGIARIVDTDQMRKKGYRLPSDQEEQTGATVHAIELSSWTGGQVASILVEATDLIPPLLHLVEAGEVKLTVLGTHAPEYVSVQGEEFHPRFGIRISTQPGDNNHDNG